MLPRPVSLSRVRQNGYYRCTGNIPGPLITLDSFVLGFLLACVLCSFTVHYGVISLNPEETMYRQVHHYEAVTAPAPSVILASNNNQSGCINERPIQLLVVVLSQPLGFGLRNAIRHTWMKNSSSAEVTVTSKFVVGLKNLSQNILDLLDKEQNNYRDMLLLDDLQDAYKNLTLKLKMTLQWVHKTFPDFDYFLKADDDSFVRIDKLAGAIRRMNCDKRLYWGYFLGHALPVRSGQWKENKWCICPHYLPYALGGGYVLSKQVVGMLMQYSPHRLKLYSNEDVAIGSWLAPYSVTRTHDLRFDVEAKSHGCNNNHIISHKQETSDFYQKHSNLNQYNKLCSEEIELIPSYAYNWTVLPTDCCRRVENLPVPA